MGIRVIVSVEEQCIQAEVAPKGSYGQYTRENAGISSESEARNLTVESLRFPGEGSSAQGKSGTKARPKGVVDDQQVDIPVPPIIV